MLGTFARFCRQHQLELAVLLCAVFFIFFRLDRADLQTDGAVYSVRALGYLDYLNTNRQTTPLGWFDTLPWWSRLSFHDAPPLIFFIQYVFFFFFGHSTLVARLPGALSGIGTVLLVMAIARELWGKYVGVLAGVFVASSTLFTWAAREPYLEGVETFFIVLCLWGFVRALERPERWPVWGVSLGAALLTKYTALLLLPATLGYLLLARRTTCRDRRFWLGLALAALLISPVAIYNIQLYRTRGHFDLQLSKLVPSTWPAARQAWPKLYQDAGNPKPIADYAASTFRYFQSTASAPWFWMSLAAVAWWTWQLFTNAAARKTPVTVVFVGLAALIAFFIFDGPAPRFLPPAVPLLALMVAAGAILLKPRIRTAAAVLIVVAAAVEGAVNVNTNHTLATRGPAGSYLKTLRLGNDGYQELAAYLAPIFARQRGYRWHPVRSKGDLLSGFEHVAGQDVFLYQSGLRWFSTFWYFQQYSIYRDLYVLGDADLAGILEVMGQETGVIHFFRVRGAARLFYIVGVAQGVFDADVILPAAGHLGPIEQAFAHNLNRGAPGNVAEIKNPNGQVAFRVYTLDFTVAPPEGDR